MTADWPVRACQCPFCRLHMALTSSDPAGTLGFYANHLSDLQRYRFGARAADWIRFVNLRTLCRMPGDLCTPASVNYDDKSPAQRMARREARWTPLASNSV
jgi:hypothetical protein